MLIITIGILIACRVQKFLCVHLLSHCMFRNNAKVLLENIRFKVKHLTKERDDAREELSKSQKAVQELKEEKNDLQEQVFQSNENR